MLSSNCLGKERLHFIKTSRKCSASIPENLNRQRTIYLHYKKYYPSVDSFAALSLTSMEKL